MFCGAVYYVWARWPEYGGGKRKLERPGEWARCASAFQPRFRLAASKHIAFATQTSSLGFHNFGFFCEHQLKENQTQANECLFSTSMLKYIFYGAIEIFRHLKLIGDAHLHFMT